MKKFFSGFLAVVLLISFVCSVYLHGTGQKFSFYLWISNIAELGELVTFRPLMDIWTKDTYFTKDDPPVEMYYKTYAGENEVLIFFDDVKAIFLRVFHTVREAISMFSKVLSDIDKLLPWTATVPDEGRLIYV